MAARYVEQIITISAVPASGSKTQNTALSTPASMVDIFKVKVEPSIAGGTSELQIYKSDTFAAAKLLYALGPESGTYYDPEQRDSGVVSEALEGFVSPYYDEDETDEWHLKILNNDPQIKSFDVTITYGLVYIDSSGGLDVSGDLDVSGQVGINDSTPTAQLEVASSLAARQAAIFRAAGSPSVNVLEVEDNNNVDKFFIDDNFKVVIVPSVQAQTPHADADELAVKATNDSGISIISGSGDLGTLLFGDAADNDVAKLQYDHNTNLFSMVANTQTAVQVAATYLSLPARDMGNDVEGMMVAVGRNTSTDTDGEAPAIIRLQCANGDYVFVWADNSHELRHSTDAPTGSTGTPTVHSEESGQVISSATT
jgi:hypothetical protein